MGALRMRLCDYFPNKLTIRGRFLAAKFWRVGFTSPRYL